MDVAKLHLLNGGFDHDNWDLNDGSNCLSWFHTNIVIIENFRRESVLRQKIAVKSVPILFEKGLEYHYRNGNNLTQSFSAVR